MDKQKADGSSDKLITNEKTVIVQMKPLTEETVFFELKMRMINGLRSVIERRSNVKDALAFSRDLHGEHHNWSEILNKRSFKVLSCNNDKMSWKEIKNNFYRVSCLKSNERIMNTFLTLKLDDSHTQDSIKGFSSYNIADSIQLQVDTNKSLDCWSIYKHSDNSREWLPCKIVGRKLKEEI